MCIRSKIFLINTLILIACDTNKEKDYSKNLVFDYTQKTVSFLNQAQQAMDSGDFNAAILLTDSAKNYAPNYPGVYFMRGIIFDRLNDFYKSENMYKKVLSLNPNYAGANFNMGNNAFNEGAYKKSISLYEKELNVQIQPNVLVNLARAYSNIYETEKSIELLFQAISIDSTYSNAHLLLGQIYKDLGEMDKSLNYTKKAFLMDPKNIDYQYFWGMILFQSGQINESLPLLKNVSNARPGYYWAQNSFGQALVRSGRQEEGDVFLRRADTLRHVDSAIGMLNKQLQTAPANIDYWLKKADLLEKIGRLLEAQEAYSIVLHFDPDNSIAKQKVSN